MLGHARRAGRVAVPLGAGAALLALLLGALTHHEPASSPSERENAAPAVLASRLAATRAMPAKRAMPATARAVRAPNPPAASARAGGGVSSAAASPARPAGFARGTAGMVVGIEPGSGDLGLPTPGQIRELEAALGGSLDRSTEGLRVVTLEDGSRRVNLRGRFRAFSIATLDASGRPVVRCVEDPASAALLLQAALSRSANPRSAAAHSARRLVGPPEE
jgi:hypothetical protein